MKVTTLRLPEVMYDTLEDEAEAEEKSVSEYIRGILRDRENTTTEYDDRIHELEDRVDDLEQRLDDRDQGETEPTDANGEIGGTAGRGTRSSGVAPQGSGGQDTGAPDDRIAGVIQQWRTGRNQEERAARREIGRAVLEWLRDQDGKRSKTDFIAALYEETHLENQKEGTWWETTARESLQLAVDAGLVDDPGRRYVWAGDDGPDEENSIYDPTSEWA